jgi:hypothetical protein
VIHASTQATEGAVEPQDGALDHRGLLSARGFMLTSRGRVQFPVNDRLTAHSLVYRFMAMDSSQAQLYAFPSC